MRGDEYAAKIADLFPACVEYQINFNLLGSIDFRMATLTESGLKSLGRLRALRCVCVAMLDLAHCRQ